MRIAGIQFPDPLIDALQNDRLVVFAGAGVSMGGASESPRLQRPSPVHLGWDGHDAGSE